MASIKILKVPKGSSFEIFGHVFHGLKEVEEAVEVIARTESLFERKPSRIEPRNPVPGIHVAEIYEPYPCFDSEDYANEDRSFSNYFFSKKPFSDAAIKKLTRLPCKMNCCMVRPDLPLSAAPVIYYDGDSDDISIAIPE